MRVMLNEGIKEVLAWLGSGHVQCSVSSSTVSMMPLMMLWPFSSHRSFLHVGCQQGVLNPRVCRELLWAKAGLPVPEESRGA